uniref:hypothetical protein n=1 Tax=Acetatifactor sp. TaxID=1872090 RepID=UPI004056CC48
MVVTIYLGEEPTGKVLDKNTATSILCDDAMLGREKQLKLVAECRDNKYYLVEDTNTVLLHVEEGFCILTDYMVGEKNLAQLMQQEHYAVYQCNGRDWIKNSATSRLVGYDIKEFVTGQSSRPQGMTLDHQAETFNEMEKNKSFSTNNVNGGSHRVKVVIDSVEGLEELIAKIKENDGKSGGLFM